MSRFSLRYPYFVLVICLLTLVLGFTSLLQLPVDLFPEIRIPVVVVATFYAGMPPEQIESSITGRFERFFTLASGVDHMESRSLPGVSLIKVYFQPGTDPDSAVTTIANLATANLRRLPPGTLPPVVLKFDASSLPVCLITLKGEGLDETQLRDQGQYNVRNQVANVPGASVPQPFGGRYRQMQVFVDPTKLESYGMSIMDVVRAVNESNLILPAGDVRVGPFDYNLYANAQVPDPAALNQIPLKTIGRSTVLVGDIGEAKDASQNQYNIVRVDGQRSVYLPVLKQGGDANTIAVVSGVRRALSQLLDVPRNLVTDVVFDQSVFVKTAVQNLIHEGLTGLVLTGVMILLFLGNGRATIGVFLSIPLSLLVTFAVLRLIGGTINTMVLGGLALALSRLIDDSVVVLENIFRHLEKGTHGPMAAEHGGIEVALPVLAATLTTVVVFFPVTFLDGVSRYLFGSLAAGVVISVLASYLVAMSVVPLFCSLFIRPESVAHGHTGGSGVAGKIQAGFNAGFESVLVRYESILAVALRHYRWTAGLILGLFIISLGLFPWVGTAYFPRTDPGQFVVNLKAPTGSRLEITEGLVSKVEAIIHQEVPDEELERIVANIGITPDFSAIYTSNAGQHTAFVQVSLKEAHKIGSYTYMARVRARLQREVPELNTYFQSGGLVDAVLNLGLPAPIDIQVTGSDLNRSHAYATELAERLRGLRGVADVLVPQDVDYPALRLDIDRQRASQLGLSEREVIQNVITALTSDGMIAPSFWVDPKTGNDYLLTVQYPENKVTRLEDLQSITLRGPGQPRPAHLDAVSRLTPTRSPTEVDHYQLRRVIDVYVAPVSEDLGDLNRTVQSILDAMPPPENTRVAVRGSVVGMDRSFRSFGFGLLLSVILVYLILLAQFRSFIDPLLILLAVPTGLTGVLGLLWITGTTFNIMSLMGVVMMVGIVVSNSILIVEFTNRLCRDGMGVREAAAMACRVRLRPILMTSLATLIGLIPMALKWGTGSEAYAPLARAIIGGLGVSVVLSVFLVPAAYVWLHDRGNSSATS